MLELIGVDGLTQWDVGRQIKVDKDVDMVHFSNRPYGYSKNVKVTDGVADVPDMFLTSCAPLRIWTYVGDFEKGYTKIEKIYEVKPKNRPEDYIYTPEEIKTWEKLQSEIGDLADLKTEAKENLVVAINEVAANMSEGVALDTTLTQSGKAADAKAVGDALAGKQPKGDYLTQDNLQSATDAALAQAKASGEFDGTDGITPHIGDNGNWFVGSDDTGKPSRGAKGEPGSPGAPGADGKTAYQYAQDGGYTGTETEFAEKLATDIPSALPNPNALTFTGAVNATYDGSTAVSVEIPSGGSGGTDISLGLTSAAVGQIIKVKAIDESGKPTAWEAADVPSGGGWELITDITLTEDGGSANQLNVTRNDKGEDFEYRQCMVCISGKVIDGWPKGASQYIHLHENNDATGSSASVMLSRLAPGAGGTEYKTTVEMSIFGNLVRLIACGGSMDTSSLIIRNDTSIDTFRSIRLSCYGNNQWVSVPLAAGGRVVIYGRK